MMMMMIHAKHGQMQMTTVRSGDNTYGEGRTRSYVRPTSHVRFCRATSSLDEVASCDWAVARCDFVA